VRGAAERGGKAGRGDMFPGSLDPARADATFPWRR